MKRSLQLQLIGLLWAVASCGGSSQMPTGSSSTGSINVAGTYVGSIHVSDTTMGVTVVLSESASGSLSGTATMTNTSSCQVPSGPLPIVAGSVGGTTVGFTVDDQWTFQGNVTDVSGSSIQGQFGFARPCTGLPFPLPPFPLTLMRQST